MASCVPSTAARQRIIRMISPQVDFAAGLITSSTVRGQIRSRYEVEQRGMRIVPACVLAFIVRCDGASPQGIFVCDVNRTSCRSPPMRTISRVPQEGLPSSWRFQLEPELAVPLHAESRFHPWEVS